VTVADKDEGRRKELVEAYGVRVTQTTSRRSGRGPGADGGQASAHAEVLAELKGGLKPQHWSCPLPPGSRRPSSRRAWGQGPGGPVMPNMPALIGEGATALAAGSAATAADLELALTISAPWAPPWWCPNPEGRRDGLERQRPWLCLCRDRGPGRRRRPHGARPGVALRLAARPCSGGEALPGRESIRRTAGHGRLAGRHDPRRPQGLEDGKIRATLMAAVEAATRRSAELGAASSGRSVRPQGLETFRKLHQGVFRGLVVRLGRCDRRGQGGDGAGPPGGEGRKRRLGGGDCWPLGGRDRVFSTARRVAAV
jgi:hypothetical protein